jgi:hypothetical protein
LSSYSLRIEVLTQIARVPLLGPRMPGIFAREAFTSQCVRALAHLKSRQIRRYVVARWGNECKALLYEDKRFLAGRPGN